MDKFKEEVATLLELAREVSMKHNKHFMVSIYPDGRGFVSGDGVSATTIDIGYYGTGKARVKGGDE